MRSHKSRQLVAVLGVATMVAVISGTSTIAGESTAAAEKLAKVGWLQGPWKATVNGDYLDEVWGPLHSDSMIGTFRWSKKDKLWMCEMLSIVTEGDNIVLRVKHFDRSLVGWEEKDKSITLPLAKQTNDESVFENDDKPEAVRLTYRKTGAETMDVILEVKGAGKERRTEFHFTRIK